MPDMQSLLSISGWDMPLVQSVASNSSCGFEERKQRRWYLTQCIYDMWYNHVNISVSEHKLWYKKRYGTWIKIKLQVYIYFLEKLQWINPWKPWKPTKCRSFEQDFRMPLPPPPSDAFSITGKPMRWAQRKASATEKRQAFLEKAV